MNILKYVIISTVSLVIISCGEAPKKEAKVETVTEETNSMSWYTEEYTEKDDDGFRWKTERFADIKIVKYQIPSWDKLSINQKKLVYFLSQAGYSGRDIIWDQNYRHNLTIRRALENIISTYAGDKNSDDWTKFMVYTKRVWFANGIHHHYSMDKFNPDFSKEYLATLLAETKTELSEEAIDAIMNPATDNKKVSLDSNKDLLLASASNFYGPDVTEKEAVAYYKGIMKEGDKEPISYGLNSQLVRGENGLEEKVWKVDGMYGEAIKEIIGWLEKAVTVAENEGQGNALKLLIEYYQTGSLEKWDEYNIAWASSIDGDIDYINSFIEVYNDPLGYRGSYETVIQINDFEASDRMSILSENCQYFEDNSSIMDEHKKKSVVGVSYKVVNVAAEAGDASPSTPIGVNLPNANWIRAAHGSKSVSLGNIVAAYEHAGGKGILAEFAYTEDEIARAEAHDEVGEKMHTALHEVIGHASGQINEGIGTPKETLKNYASTLEEARADLVGLYYLYDNKLIEMGLIESLEVGMAQYESYIRNGMMLQLRRLEPGAIIEEAHMRNRQLVAAWAFEKGAADSVITKEVKDGKTYFVVNDFAKLRVLFGDLLKEIQRIKSEGDYEAGKALVENYGVQVDQAIHAEVLERTSKLNIAPYGGFINPKLVPEMDEAGKIININVEYPDDFETQMMDYAKNYSFLPSVN